MLVDIVLPAGRPSTASTSAKTCPATWTAPATALSYPWKHLIAGHRAGWAPATMSPCTSSTSPTSKSAPGRHSARSTPRPYFAKYGENLWAAVKGFLDAVADTAAAPVIEKYTGVLGAVDVFTVPTAFSILESIRLDLGYRMDVHP